MAKYEKSDLFKGAAEGYAKFRLGYPKELFDYLVEYFKLNGTGRLLDLGCGTGQVTIPLAPYFEEVIGLDPDEDMLRVGKLEAEKVGVKNIQWVQKRAEDISKDMGKFRVVTAGAAFHWMEQEKVLEKIYELLEPGGGLAIISGSSSVWRNPEKSAWKEKCKEVIQKYLGPERRAGKSIYQVIKEPFEDIITRSVFKNAEKWTYDYDREWTIDGIIGLLYTTSFASKWMFGNQAENFEKDLRDELLKFNPEGKFSETIHVEALLSKK